MPTLHWLTKDDDVRAASKVPYRLLEEVSELGAGDRSSGNMLIQGDNLEALKALKPFFSGQVKCIYIDPPYNTKSAFEQYDDNLEHSQWLAMIYPRLELLRDLLAEDGSIWISIDDNEGHYLKVIMDEIFGRKHFILSIAWQKRDGPPNDRKIGLVHEHIMVWGKAIDTSVKANTLRTLGEQKFGLMPRTEKADAQYSLFEEPTGFDPRGPFRKIDTTTNAKGGRNVESLIYPLRNPFTGIEYLPRKGRNWAHNREDMAALQADGRLFWGKKGTATTPMRKLFKSEAKDGMTTPSIWSGLALNQHASGEMEKIFGEKAAFETPKPEKLIERILTIASRKGDIVLDSFIGSGTTAAVAHKMGRRYIGIEMGSHAVTHCQPRLQKVIDGEQGGISESVNWKGGGGFRFYRLGAPVFDAAGHISKGICFPVLAAHIWFSETGFPWNATKQTPYLGSHDGRGFALLYNGILGDKSVSGGNVLTRQTLALIRKESGQQPLTIYGERSALGAATLNAENIIFKQTPYDVKARA